MKYGRYKPWMVFEFYDFNKVFLGGYSRKDHTALTKAVPVSIVKLIAVAVALHYYFRAVGYPCYGVFRQFAGKAPRRMVLSSMQFVFGKSITGFGVSGITSVVWASFKPHTFCANSTTAHCMPIPMPKRESCFPGRTLWPLSFPRFHAGRNRRDNHAIYIIKGAC